MQAFEESYEIFKKENKKLKMKEQQGINTSQHKKARANLSAGEKKTIRERDQAGQQKARDNLSVKEKKTIRERDQTGHQKARDN